MTLSTCLLYLPQLNWRSMETLNANLFQILTAYVKYIEWMHHQLIKYLPRTFLREGVLFENGDPNHFAETGEHVFELGDFTRHVVAVQNQVIFLVVAHHTAIEKTLDKCIAFGLKM